MRLLTALAFLMSLAPVAAQETNGCPEGQVETPEGCSQQAWVEDCPPDMMCAAGAPDGDGAGAGDAEPEPLPSCDGEVCAYGEDCIECSGPVDSCMDGSGEACDEDVQYVGGPDRGPADCENCHVVESHAPAQAASGAGIGAAVALVALALVLGVARRA